MQDQDIERWLGKHLHPSCPDATDDLIVRVKANPRQRRSIVRQHVADLAHLDGPHGRAETRPPGPLRPPTVEEVDAVVDGSTTAWWEPRARVVSEDEGVRPIDFFDDESVLDRLPPSLQDWFGYAPWAASDCLVDGCRKAAYRFEVCEHHLRTCDGCGEERSLLRIPRDEFGRCILTACRDLRAAERLHEELDRTVDPLMLDVLTAFLGGARAKDERYVLQAWSVLGTPRAGAWKEDWYAWIFDMVERAETENHEEELALMQQEAGHIARARAWHDGLLGERMMDGRLRVDRALKIYDLARDEGWGEHPELLMVVLEGGMSISDASSLVRSYGEYAEVVRRAALGENELAVAVELGLFQF